MNDASAKRDAGSLIDPSAATVSAGPRDKLGRRIHDLRISVTDRCNFRCVYCMPKEVFGHDYPFLPHADLLTFEEITRIARVFVGLGVRKIRLTGGEPLLRRHLEKLVAMLPRKRVGQPQDLDSLLMMLCANESHFINGAVIQADDGFAL